MPTIEAAEFVGYLLLGLGLLGAFGDISAHILNLNRFGLGQWFKIILFCWYLVLLLAWAALFGRIQLI